MNEVERADLEQARRETIGHTGCNTDCHFVASALRIVRARRELRELGAEMREWNDGYARGRYMWADRIEEIAKGLEGK